MERDSAIDNSPVGIDATSGEGSLNEDRARPVPASRVAIDGTAVTFDVASFGRNGTGSVATVLYTLCEKPDNSWVGTRGPHAISSHVSYTTPVSKDRISDEGVDWLRSRGASDSPIVGGAE